MGTVLAGAAVAFDRPTLLVGAAGVGAWLLAAQVAFARAVSRADAALELSTTLSSPSAPVDDPVTLTVSVPSLPERLTGTLQVRLPPGVDHVDGDASVAVPDARENVEDATATLSIKAVVAGRHALPAPVVTLRDAGGLFVESLPRGDPPTLEAEPRGPRDVHVGAGGEQLPTAFGEHVVEQRGGGVEPIEVREYVPGDAAERIDWKATARLATPYVREYEAETDLRTLLVVDARATMHGGRPGETKLDYVRTVALGILAVARSFDDLVGLVVVDGEGATVHRPTNTTEGYEAIRRRLHGLTAGEERPIPRDELADPLARRADHLPAEGAVAETLGAFLGGRTPLPSGAAPLRAGVRLGGTGSGAARTVVFTDDSDRRALRDALEEARRTSRVVAFVTPTVAFEPGALADPEAAYDRYRDFESFRRSVDRLGRVEAYEVAPGPRLDAVLAAATGPR